MKETIVKINKTESCFSEKINKIDKPFVSLIRKKREKNQIKIIRNEKGEVTTDNAEMQKIMPGSSPGGSRVIRRWGWSQCLWKNTYLITDIERD